MPINKSMLIKDIIEPMSLVTKNGFLAFANGKKLDPK
jgi:hypothetical protein